MVMKTDFALENLEILENLENLENLANPEIPKNPAYPPEPTTHKNPQELLPVSKKKRKFVTDFALSETRKGQDLTAML